MLPAVYTVLTGGYERLVEQPDAAASGVELICFTDDPGLTSATWELRPLVPRLGADPVRSARWAKLHPHVLLPDHDVSLYVDNAVRLTGDPRELLDLLLPADRTLGLVAHSFRSDVSAEMDVVAALRLDSSERVEEQRGHYARLDRGSLDVAPLWTGILARRHHEAEVVAAMELWWEHVLRYSRRDQLSLPFCLRATGLEPVVRALDNHRSDWWTWPTAAGRVPHQVRPSAAEVQVAELSALAQERMRAVEELKDELAALAAFGDDRADQLGQALAASEAERTRLVAEVAAAVARGSGAVEHLQGVVRALEQRLDEAV